MNEKSTSAAVARKHIFASGRKDIDMTEGTIWRHILKFAFPLLLGNLFQQLYNTVDTWVVGNHVSNEAYAAVGNVGPAINTLIGFFVGLSSGAGAVISQYYGAKKYDKVRETVHTSIVMTAILGVLFTVLGIFITPFLLRMMKTPESVFAQGRAYLSIYFAGIIGLMFYNMGSGILRAVGDSKRPFYFLVVSALINTGLDLLFVIVLKMGVEGVAYATIIAQGVSAVLVIITLMRSEECIKILPSYLKINFDILKKIVKIGIPAAVQMAITAFSNVFVQSYINYFDADCMSGWTSYNKIDQFALLPMQSIALASTTFVGQNIGCGNDKRARKGTRVAVLMGISSTVIIMIPIMALAPHLVAFFNDKPEVVAYGALLIRVMSPFYVFCCINQIYAGALRGSGKSQIPMIIMLTSFVFFRQLYLYVMKNFIRNEIIPITLAYPAGWMLASALILIYYNKTKLSDNRVVVDNK